jgi:hypothetical protein
MYRWLEHGSKSPDFVDSHKTPRRENYSMPVCNTNHRRFRDCVKVHVLSLLLTHEWKPDISIHIRNSVSRRSCERCHWRETGIVGKRIRCNIRCRAFYILMRARLSVTALCDKSRDNMAGDNDGEPDRCPGQRRRGTLGPRTGAFLRSGCHLGFVRWWRLKFRGNEGTKGKIA